jgi:hypothetical protein
VNVAFEVLVTVLPQHGVVPSALLELQPEWLLVTVGLELFAFVAAVAACVAALGAVLGTTPSAAGVVRYAAVLGALRLLAVRATVTGDSILIGLPLLVGFLYVVVRLVPLPGRLVLGDSLATALRRSWDRTRGYGWSLFGVVLLLGLANDLLAVLPLVGPVGSALVAAVHAGVVATFLARTDGRGPSGGATPSAVPAD